MARGASNAGVPDVQPHGSAGRALVSAITAAYELDPRELVVLDLAARQADDVAALELQLAEGGIVVAGSRGQPRLAAAVGEARLARLALARLLDQLALPAEEEDAGRSASSRRAQRAAIARWDRFRAVQEARRG